MKTFFRSCTIAFAISLPVSAEALKVELSAPKEPVVISLEQLKELAAAGDAAEAYEAEMSERKLDRESLIRLQKMAMVGQRAKQGIELKYRIINTSDEAITFEHGGDSTSVLLEVTGPGSVNLPYKGVMTMDFRLGRSITVESGKSKEFAITELKYGKRDMSRWLITKAGDYEVVLTYAANIGGERVELKSSAAKFAVKTQ